MRLLIISPKFHPVIGGGETFVLNSAKKLHETGVDITVAVEPHKLRNLEDYPFEVQEIGGLSDTNLDVKKAAANLSTLINSLLPDVIHAHGYFALLAVGLCNTDTPIIVSIHSTPVWGERIVGGMCSFDAEVEFARRTLEIAKPKILTAANHVYSDAAKRVAGVRTRVETVPYPVDIDHFYNQFDRSMRQEFGLTSYDRLLITPSRIIERKGIKEAVLALAELPKN